MRRNAFLRRFFCAALLVHFILNSTADAAKVTLDMRVLGGSTSKSRAILSPNEVVTLQIWFVLASTNSTHTDDSFYFAQGSVLSTDSGLLGDLSAFTANTSVVTMTDTSFATFQAGAVQNLDANPDMEVGSGNPSVIANWIVMPTANGVLPVAGTGSGSGPTEFLLGTVTWTAPAVLPASGNTLINFNLRNKTDTGIKSFFQGFLDGAQFSYNGGTDVTAGNTGVGTSVVLTVPEPGTGLIIALIPLALGIRRRHNRSSQNDH